MIAERSAIRAVAVRALAAGLLWLGACSGGVEPRDAADLTNARLGPAYAQWLVGPVAAMATSEEEREFMALENDFAAADFIEAFWRRRDPNPSAPGNAVREVFERRVEEAERKFSESGVSGRKTARGVIYVLYGPPARTDYEIPRKGGPAVEVWFYPDDAPPGLDGRQPQGSYRFQKRGDVTGFYRPGGPPERPPGPRPR